MLLILFVVQLIQLIHMIFLCLSVFFLWNMFPNKHLFSTCVFVWLISCIIYIVLMSESNNCSCQFLDMFPSLLMVFSRLFSKQTKITASLSSPFHYSMSNICICTERQTERVVGKKWMKEWLEMKERERNYSLKKERERMNGRKKWKSTSFNNQLAYLLM